MSRPDDPFVIPAEDLPPSAATPADAREIWDPGYWWDHVAAFFTIEMLLSTLAFVGILIAAATYLILRARAYEILLALLLLAHAGNLFVLSMGGLVLGAVPILGEEDVVFPDPVPQALVLTAIVINFAVTAFVLVWQL